MMLKKKRHQWFTVFLIGTVVIMMGQNYFLFRKNNQHLERVRFLDNQLTRLLQVVDGDVITPFQALNLDSSFILIDPGTDNNRKLLLVFTTSCSACVENMGQWNQLANEFPTTNLGIHGICIDSLYKMKNFMARVFIDFPTFSIGHDFCIVKKHKFSTFPQTVLIDTSGVVLKVWTGVLTDATRKEIVTFF